MKRKKKEMKAEPAVDRERTGREAGAGKGE